MPVHLGSPTLLLIPTALERRRLEDLGGLPPGTALFETAGFGPVAAAARTAELLARLTPRRVLLAGIAGAYDTGADPIGSALVFDAVALTGVGVGEGAGLLGPPALGFPQWPAGPGTPAIEDRLPLHRPRPVPAPGGLLLTTCAASADAEQAAERRRRFPAARAEDMEGFAVALACALAGVPLAIVRGISNLVGDREPTRWSVPRALAAVHTLLPQLFEGEWEPPTAEGRP